MALPLPPINPNQPIPNDPFYYPEQNYIQGEYSPFIVGSGLSLDNISGVLSASGVGSSLAAGAGISLSTVGTITTIANIGVLSVIGTSPVSVTGGQNPNVSVGTASTVTPGVVQLNNTTTSSSVSQALTAAAGYSLQQQIDALVISNNLTLAGTVDGSTGLVVTVTAEGTLKGFSVGSALPAPSSTNAECFVIVTTAGTMTPTGGVATVVNQGDWWVSDGTSWIYYPVGFDPTYATTTTPGVVQLATNAEVQAGTESTHAVTSSALQSKLSDSVNLVSSTCIASSTAVKTANDTALAAQADATQALADALTAQTTANDALADAAAAQFTANAAIPCACYTAKGDILGGTGSGTFSALSPGTDGQMLYALSSATNGLQWANPPADIPCAVITAVGDIVVGSAPSTPTALPVGANGYILAANSACTTGLEWVANSQGDVTSVTGTAPITVDNTNPQTPIIGASVATTTATGVVSVGTNINVTGAGAISVPAATTTSQGAVQVGTNINVTSGTISVPAATTTSQGAVQAGTNIQVASGTISVLSATTAQSGVVQLNDTTTSTSVTEALTANQGKNLQDQINALSITSNITLAGTLNTATGNLVTVTTAGAAAGFTVGSPLPAAAAGNAEYFVIVTVATASYTPPGGTATQTHVGDWFLSDGTVWDFLDVGFDPPYASTTTPGVVQLATNAQVQAGTDATLAVTPTGAAATYVPLAGYTAKGAILAATAANTPSALPVGANGRVLYANSACSTGLCWGVLPAAPGAAQPQTLGLVYGCTTDFSGCNNTSLGFLGLGECITTGQSNVALGASAAYWMSSGCYNVAVGGSALFSLTNEAESNNVAIGYLAQANGGGSSNTSVGTCAGCNVGTGNIGGDNNAFFGYRSGVGVTSGCCNTFLGNLSGSDVTTGSSNVAIGSGVTVASTTGSCQLAIGFAAGQTWLTGTSTKAIKPGAGIIDCANSCGTAGQVLMSNGSNAICWGSAAATPAATPTVAGIVLGCTTATVSALGCNALLSNTSGLRNTAAGFESLCANSTGNDNTAFGFCSGRLITGNSNTLIGSFSGRQAAAASGNAGLGRNTLCSLTTGGSNTSVGTESMMAVSTGQLNTALGSNALGSGTGSTNVALGAYAGCNLTTGSANVAIGCGVTLASATSSCQLAIGFSTGCNWLTGNSTKAIQPGAGIIDCAGSCGTAGQVLTSNGSNAIAWATPATLSYTANKALTSGTPINLLSWASGVRMGTLTVMATDNSSNVKWANITIGSASGIGSSAVLTQSVGVGNFSIIAGGSGETIVRFTPSVTLASVDFVYQYTVAFGAQPSVL